MNKKIIRLFLLALTLTTNVMPAASSTPQRMPILHHLAMQGFSNLIPDVLVNGLNVEAQDHLGLTALHVATRYGYAEFVTKLLDKLSANVNCRDINKLTPLYHAAAQGNTSCLEILIKHGASLNATAIDNSTPLHAAARYGKTASLVMLIRYGAFVNSIDNHLATPLHHAAAHGRVKCLEILINNGASLDVTTIDNFTPLHTAAINGNLNCVRLLIQAGASPLLLTKNGETAQTLARKKGFKKIADFLCMKHKYNTL